MKNHVTRGISGVLFTGIMIAGLLIGPYVFAALFILLMAGMLWEFYRMTMGEHYKVERILAILVAVFFFCQMFLSVTGKANIRYIGLSIVPLTVIMILSLYVKNKEDFGLFSNLYAGLLYIGLPLSLANFVVVRGGVYSGILMLSFFVIIWASDVGAYSFGMLLGKNGRKLFPSISPKKSWAGFWGGLAMAIVAGIVLQLTGLLDIPLWHAAALAVIMNIAGVYGDLFESQWKRVSGIKDSGNLIPGHGGLLDRFDSAIFAIPFGVVYLVIFNLI